MIKTKRRLYLCAVLLALNILFIWGNSMLPASVSGAISHWVRDLLAEVFSGDSSGTGGHGLVRKLAHFTEFACLGSLLAWLLGMLGRKTVWAVLGGFLVASVDETIQIFVPGRGPGILDVLLDTCGALSGIGLLLLGHTILKKRAKKALEDTKS